MTRYVLGLLRRPPDGPSPARAESDRLQDAHLALLRRLREAGDLLASGPVEEEADLREILIFSVPSIDRARKLMLDDPALREGRLVLELFTWYGPAGLRAVPYALPPTDLDFESD